MQVGLIYSLHKNVAANDVDGVNKTLDAGADVNEVDYYGNTPLHVACIVDNGNAEIVSLLLRRRARPDIRNNSGQLPADVATDEVIKQLLPNSLLQ
jgi:ankyrin repeat protein